jgi:hypothetical protein
MSSVHLVCSSQLWPKNAYTHLLPLPFGGQDLLFRQADKHMHMHARIDEGLRLPDQQEWDVRDKNLQNCPRGQTGCICTPHAIVVARSPLRTATRRRKRNKSDIDVKIWSRGLSVKSAARRISTNDDDSLAAHAAGASAPAQT